MSPWFTSRSSKRSVCLSLVMGALALGWAASAWSATTVDREPVTMRVVAVNPSAEKTRTVPVRIDLPQEVKPDDILDHGELEVEFDTDRSTYYVFKADVQLAPKQTKVFEVVVRDVWFIPEEELTGLRTHTNLMLEKLKPSEYYPFAQQLGSSILKRLEGIETMQKDETIGRKQRIGSYRMNLQALKVIKEDLARMEKLLTFTGGPPVPEMMEESPLKSDAPSTTTTWLVIFLIVIFMGLLAGQFFFTWHRRIKAMPEPIPGQLSGPTAAGTGPAGGSASGAAANLPLGRPTSPG